MEGCGGADVEAIAARGLRGLGQGGAGEKVVLQDSCGVFHRNASGGYFAAKGAANQLREVEVFPFGFFK